MTASPPPGDRRALRVYRVLLRLFPWRFRAERSDELERLFLDMRAAHRSEGGRSGPGFWLPLIWDTASHALRERLAGPRAHPAGMTSPASLMNALRDARADLRHAVRVLVREPFYASLVVLMMTLGIAGNAAVFRIFNGLFIRPLPFEDASELVDLDTRAPRWNLEYTGVAYADFHGWREGNRTFQGMGVFTMDGANLAGDDGAVRVDAVRASHDLPAVLGLEAAHGRLFTAEDDVPGGPAIALLAHAFWERRYGSDPEVVGRAVVLNGRSFEVVGILPPEASFVLDEAELWIPLQEDPDAHSSFYLDGVGRLRPGVTLESAEEDLTRIHRAMAERFPMNEDTRPVVSSLRDRYLGDHRLGSSVLLGAVAVVLLIACANIAGLMLARSLGRRRDVQIRLAMGARPGRIARQFLTESLFLATIGATLGTVLGVRASGALVAGLGDQFPSWVTFELDGAFVVFTAAVTLAAVVVFGMAPALQTAAADPTGCLQAGAERTTASRRRGRAMNLLVTAEVALAFVLLVVAGLTLRDFGQLTAISPGFRTEGILTYDLQLPAQSYTGPEERLAFWNAHVAALEARPEVTRAAGTTVLPLAGHSGWFFTVEDAPSRAEDDPNPVVLLRAVSEGYFDAMDIELAQGRFFDRREGGEEGGWVAVVNESFVREFLAHRGDPVGARIRTGSDDDDPWSTVVGVTRNTRHYGLDEEMRPAVYQPLVQLPRSGVTMAVRTDGDPAALVELARATLREQDSSLAMFDVKTMGERLSESLWPRRAAAWLMAVFSTVALLLAVAGIYGVVSYAVRQRVREIGIRMALGARQGEVAGHVLRQGLGIVGGGVALGAVCAWFLGPLVAEALFSVSPSDPVAFAGAALILLSVAAVANLLPAWRAAKLDPMEVLRGE